MKEEKIDRILNALSVPIVVLAFLPVWMVVSSIEFVAIVPDPRILIGTIYASFITISFICFGLKLRNICK